ncbi:uncharacterized protein isoform X1 [Danio rerio]|uniref:Uncharacterized protein isoform X1 n=3 Tax=Danio rerio TaxID=7955 RepID=A0AC58JF37_DANRE
MEADMAEVARRLSQRCELPPRTQMEFRSFCVATLVWLHRLGPGSVRELKVRPAPTPLSLKTLICLLVEPCNRPHICSYALHAQEREWLGRRPEGDAVILTLPSEAVSLSRKEKEWLECYFRHVRPLCLKAYAAGTDDKGCFFLGASGLALTNPTADIQRLKAKYVKRQPPPPLDLLLQLARRGRPPLTCNPLRCLHLVIGGLFRTSFQST